MSVKRLVALSGNFSNASIQHRLKYLVSAALIALVLYLSVLNRQWAHPEHAFPVDRPYDASPSTPHDAAHDAASHDQPPLASRHTIFKLAQEAQVNFKQLLGKRSVSLDQAASRYRERRGRHPPPGFDAWYAAAKDSNAVVVEDFFDRIYKDIGPFWALDPARLRRMIKDEKHYIRVRNGKAWFISEHLELRQPWVQRWTELVEEMMPHLPDLDMVLNVMDETRVLVPWETISEYVTEEQRNRQVFNPAEAQAQYTKYQDEPSEKDESAIKVDWVIDEQHKYWDHYRVTCPPDAPGRNVSSLETLPRPPVYPTEPMPFAVDGFIKNFTASSDPCLQPHIRGMHGTFIESVSMATTHSLFPIFGGCKLPGNNEILIPAGMILDSYDLFSGGETHGGPWAKKKNELVWRGVASGGRNKEENWWAFQRHRFVQMMNGTAVSLSETDPDATPSFNLSGLSQYEIRAQKTGELGKWLSSFSDAAFMGYECFPRQEDESCPYIEPYMALRKPIHMKEQYDFKFLPDIDGNSYSGRFRAFMRSTSLVLKSTIYAEWHDDRLVPWVHFVPFDNTYIDIYAILDYYLNGHDDEAYKIAEEGRDWSEKVMRREDMKLYVWRLLLEYARVMDPARDRLGFVADLKG
ncbi:putative lipopolysaccharide-modifying protein [Rosellinia necatrix]|uniref:Putative lipopolysaccharide-modifying protein n=1 Tax=Rosellinia necatrix TaxID=77044 RepID=A0A1W2TSP3_ROSNE|nr:putative lipopolysaccharide-modifying protein [Rosellinia necatrix]